MGSRDDPRVADVRRCHHSYRGRMPEHIELIRLVQAVSVLDGIDVRATDGGLVPADSDSARPISWQQVTGALAGDDPLDPAPRHRLALVIALHRVIAELGDGAARRLAGHARLLALPVGHPLNPGDGWGVQPVPGGVLELGLGVVELLPGQLSPQPLPPSVALLAGLHAGTPGDPGTRDHVVPVLWTRLVEQAERLGDLAGRQLATTGDRAAVISVGGCDALTLTTTAALRRHLVGCTGQSGGGNGMAIAAPRRDRVWTGERSGDRDRIRAVWLLTASPERGVLEPLRITETGVEPVHTGVEPARVPLARVPALGR
jgi:hypothetical protein